MSSAECVKTSEPSPPSPEAISVSIPPADQAGQVLNLDDAARLVEQATADLNEHRPATDPVAWSVAAVFTDGASKPVAVLSAGEPVAARLADDAGQLIALVGVCDASGMFLLLPQQYKARAARTVSAALDEYHRSVSMQIAAHQNS